MSRWFGFGRGSIAGVVAYVTLLACVGTVMVTSLGPLA